jgi:hypothetical protein
MFLQAVAGLCEICNSGASALDNNAAAAMSDRFLSFCQKHLKNMTQRFVELAGRFLTPTAVVTSCCQALRGSLESQLGGGNKASNGAYGKKALAITTGSMDPATFNDIFDVFFGEVCLRATARQFGFVQTQMTAHMVELHASMTAVTDRIAGHGMGRRTKRISHP